MSPKHPLFDGAEPVFDGFRIAPGPPLTEEQKIENRRKATLIMGWEATEGGWPYCRIDGPRRLHNYRKVRLL